MFYISNNWTLQSKELTIIYAFQYLLFLSIDCNLDQQPQVYSLKY